MKKILNGQHMKVEFALGSTWAVFALRKTAKISAMAFAKEPLTSNSTFLTERRHYRDTKSSIQTLSDWKELKNQEKEQKGLENKEN